MFLSLNNSWVLRSAGTQQKTLPNHQHTTSGQRGDSARGRESVGYSKKKKPLFYSLSRSFYFFFVNVLSRMIFPPLRTNPTDILPLSHIPPFVFFLSPSGGGGVVFVSHSTGLPLPVCNMSSCVGPLNSTTGRKIHPESSRKHSWPFFFVHFFFPFFLSFFFTCYVLFIIITTTQG